MRSGARFNRDKHEHGLSQKHRIVRKKKNETVPAVIQSNTIASNKKSRKKKQEAMKKGLQKTFTNSDAMDVDTGNQVTLVSRKQQKKQLNKLVNEEVIEQANTMDVETLLSTTSGRVLQPSRGTLLGAPLW